MKRDPPATDTGLPGLVRQARLAAPAIATVLLAFNAGGFFFGATAVLAASLGWERYAP